MDRLEKLLLNITRTARILEIGPSHNPVAPKAAGWRTFVLDHATQADLREKYRGHDVRHDRIEPVDFVWSDGAIHEAVPASEHGSFDACIASHVLEHLPDPVGFFASLEQLLTADGVISLALPDKRFCFDYFRPLTFVPAWIEAFESKSARHSRRALLESTVYQMTNGPHYAWGQFNTMNLRLRGELDLAKKEAEPAGQSHSIPYVDCHAWCFTPSSFELLILELDALGLIGFRIAKLFPTDGCEFIVLLRKGRSDYGAGIQSRRLELLKATVRELGDQDRRMKTRFPPKIVHRAIHKMTKIVNSVAKRRP